MSTKSFPVSQILKNKVESFINGDGSPKELKELKSIINFIDIQYDVLRSLLCLYKEEDSTKKTESFIQNSLKLIDILLIALDANSSAQVFNNEKSPLAIKTEKENKDELKRQFTMLWMEIMKVDKNKEIHKRILLLLPEKVLKNLNKPLHMSDYLLSAFDLGGPLSLMALQGIFVLMTTYNFEVTDFYARLYSMFKPSILLAKYRARFFAYSSQFLASTHLPEYLVAAFIKKLSRLSLHAPAPSIPLILDFILNLLIQHPGLQKMIYQESGPVKFESDPFIENEADPVKTKAIESMLWEIKTLQSHAVPQIAIQAQFVNHPIGRIEKDLDDTLSLTYDEMFENEVKKKKSFHVYESCDKRTKLIYSSSDFTTEKYSHE